MKKFGIYLAYPPEASLKNQGLGRFLGLFLDGTKENPEKIIIACPKWLVQQLTDLLEDMHIPMSQMEIVSTKNIPLLVRVRQLLTVLSGHNTQKNNKSLMKKAYLYLKLFFKKIKKSLLSVLMNFVAASGIFEITVGLFLIIITSPLFFLYCALYFAQKIYSFTSKHTYYFDRFSQKYLNNQPRFNSLKNLFKEKIINSLLFKKNNIIFSLYDFMLNKELARLNKKINRRKDIKAWLFTSLFWPQTKNIHAKKIMISPDIVYLDFPVPYVNTSFRKTHIYIEQSLDIADKLICYSDYVKKQHLEKMHCVPEQKVQIIHHGWIDLSSYLPNPTDSSMTKKMLNDWFHSRPNIPLWQKGFDLANTTFFFYSSQARPHKNLFNLIKAYEYLLRRKYVNCKLILTAKITEPKLLEYIKKKRLQFDVIELYHVPSSILAALNTLAVCAVNPTYFEGGFPFTFSEAYSVGTPSIMSNIPVVQEIITDLHLAKAMLFEPSEYEQIAEKMAYAYENRDTLLSLQRPLAEKLMARTWKTVSNEYRKTLAEIEEA